MQIVQNAQTAPDRAGMYICMGVCCVIAVSRSGERGDGGWPDAGHWYPFAANECGRLKYDFGFFDAGACEQCPAPAICELAIDRDVDRARFLRLSGYGILPLSRAQRWPAWQKNGFMWAVVLLIETAPYV